LKPRIYSFIPAIAWLILTIVLLVIPGPDVPSAPIFDLVYFDKWVHIGMFGILTFLWCFPFLKTEVASLKLFILITVCSILLGIVMEYVQKYVAFERDFDVLDMVADGVGSILALLWLSYFLRRKTWRKNKPL
jgi:VanZ family protein